MRPKNKHLESLIAHMYVTRGAQVDRRQADRLENAEQRSSSLVALIELNSRRSVVLATYCVRYQIPPRLYRNVSYGGKAPVCANVRYGLDFISLLVISAAIKLGMRVEP
jgi:hypothetical protein